jgi:hypothetical protein
MAMNIEPHRPLRWDDADEMVEQMAYIEADVMPLLDTMERKRLMFYALLRVAYLRGRSPAHIVECALQVYEAVEPELSGIGHGNDNLPH